MQKATPLQPRAKAEAVIAAYGRGRSRGRGRGRGRSARGVEEPEELLSVRAARQVSARHIANLSAADKKELLARKRVKELQRVLLPDAPPRKRRTLNPSPEREQPLMAASAAASQLTPPAEHQYGYLIT